MDEHEIVVPTKISVEDKHPQPLNLGTESGEFDWMEKDKDPVLSYLLCFLLQVLLVCFVFCTITYAAMAVSGYLMFGSNVQSHITLNLPIEKLSSEIAIYTTLVNPISKYAQMVTPLPIPVGLIK